MFNKHDSAYTTKTMKLVKSAEVLKSYYSWVKHQGPLKRISSFRREIENAKGLCKCALRRRILIR